MPGRPARPRYAQGADAPFGRVHGIDGVAIRCGRSVVLFGATGRPLVRLARSKTPVGRTDAGEYRCPVCRRRDGEARRPMPCARCSCLGINTRYLGLRAMPDTLVLTDFILIDGTGRPPTAGSSVVVEEDHIVAVRDEVRRPAGACVIEGRGRWLLPGLWDTHIHHVFSGGGFVWAEEFSDQQRLWSWRGCLRSGVTSVVSVGDDKEIVLSARAREADGSLLAPRVFVSGMIFTAPGGHPCGVESG